MRGTNASYLISHSFRWLSPPVTRYSPFVTPALSRMKSGGIDISQRSANMDRTKVIIMGAAGRDFHNFNTFFRDKEEYEVVAFTATQIPGIADKFYPPVLAGDLYPRGIPIYSESILQEIMEAHGVRVVVFAYSDVQHEYVMHKASEVLVAGADFWLMGPNSTMLKSSVPVISICAARTGSGKSQTSRKV